jgi:prepilin-type N-terminal cleavage/methylation domain-containing protein
MSRSRGLTLIELLISLMMSSIIIVAVASSYVSAIRFQAQSRKVTETRESRIRLEQRLRDLLKGAYVSSVATDPLTYMLGESTGDSATAGAADTLTFTTISEGFSTAGITDEDDFSTAQDRIGPQGGISEVSFSTVPIGGTAQNLQGLFVREQRPADGDPSQGGYESLLDPDVKSIQFEFYNGTEWATTWSTSGVNPGTGVDASGEEGRRIPSAIRVTYTLSTDPDDMQHMFIVRLPHSDATSLNPVVPTGGVTP